MDESTQVNETLHGLVCNLADLRAQLEEAENEYQEKVSVFKSEYERIQQLKVDVKAAEVLVRDSAISDFVRTGDKKPHGNVSIKMFEVVDYDTEPAKEWAVSNAPFLLDLNPKRYEQLLKSGVAPAMPGMIIDDPRAQIDRDLSSLLSRE